MALIRRYGREEQARFPQIFAALVEALQEEPGDVLGAVFGELEQGNSARGQFFTPYHVCKLMADITVGDGAEIRNAIQKRGFFTCHEPAVGAGAMVIALAMSAKDAGINFQEHLHVTAVDVDPRAVHMAYVQFSLLHIPAMVIVGNTLTLEEREHWITPAHVMGLWDWKLRRGYALGSEADTPVDQELAPRMTTALPEPTFTLLQAKPEQFDMFRVPA